MKPDADISLVWTQLLTDIATGAVPPPSGYTAEQFHQAVRDYMNSAAWLLRLADEGNFRFYSVEEFVQLFEDAGFAVTAVHESFGPPHQAVVLRAERP
jgi:hypothetical protein